MKTSQQGFTLIEVLMAVILLSILAAVSISLVGSNVDANRYEETRAKMEVIRTAIVGDSSVDANGQRTHFGYHGDWGSLPAALTNLTTSQAPAWTFDNTYGFGAGWNGPYAQTSFTASSLTQDAWGRNFVYSPAASPPTLTSYGADGAAGGTGYNQDLTIQFPTTMRFSTVKGVVSNTNARISGVTVEIRYPVAGVITAFTVVSDANGAFSFANVPFGVRSLRVTTAPALGPKQIVVDNVNSQVPVSVLNYYNGTVSYVNGTASTSGTNNSNANATLSSTYNVIKQVAFLTVSWTGAGYITSATVNGTTQAVANLASGTRFAVAASQYVAALSNNNTFSVHIAANSDGTGNQNMTGQTISVTFEWVGGGAMDDVTYP